MGKLEGLTIDLGLNTVGVDEGLRGLQRKLKVVNSEMDANLSAFSKGEQSIERYSTTLQGLNKKMEVQSKIVSEAKKNYNDLKNKQDELTQSINKAEKEVQQSKKAYEALANSQTASKKELADAKKVVTESERAYEKLNKELIEMPKAIDNAANEVNKQVKSYNRMQESVDNTRISLEKLQKEQKETISGFDKVASKMSSMGDKMQSFGSGAMSRGQTMTLGVTAPIAAFGATSIQQAGEYDAAASQFKEVFKGMEKDATSSLDKISEKTGLLPNGLRGTYTQMAAFAKTTGADTKEAIDLTSRATLAAADSAAFYDKSIDEVTENLQSFLKGNYENDAALGISATETTRNAKANELYGKSFAELSEQQKQLTLLKMVEDGNKLAGAMGQAAREQDQLSTQTANAKTAFADFQAEIGKPVLPVAVDLLKDLTGAAKGASKWFGGLSDNQKKWVLGLAGVAAAAGPTLMAIGAMSSGIGALSKGFSLVGGGFKLFTKHGRETSKVAGGLSKVFGGLKNGIGGINKVFGTVGNVIGKIGPKAFSLLSKSIGGVTRAFGLLRIAFATNPLGVVLLGVTALGIGLVALYKKNEKFRNAVNAMGKQVKKIFGSLVDWAKNLGTGFGKGFNKAVDSVKSFGENVGKRFGNMKEGAIKHSKNLYKGVTGWFKDTSEGIKSRTSKAYNWAKDNFSKMSSKSIALSVSLAKGTLNKFSDVRDGIKSRTGQASDWAKKNFEEMRKSSIDKAKLLYNGVSSFIGNTRDKVKNVTSKMRDLAVGNFKSMYDKATSWVRKIGQFIDDIKGRLSSKAGNLGKSVANGAIVGLNGMINGINKISSKIMDKNLLKPIPKLSTGTLVSNGEITRPTLAIVGDKGPGNGPGGFTREIIEKHDGSQYLTPATDTLVKLDPGDKVRNGNYTYNAMKNGLIPRFSLGTDMWNGVKDFGTSVRDTVKDASKMVGKIVGDVFEYIENPGKLVDMVLGKLGGMFDGVGGFTGKLGKAAFNSLKKALVGKVKGWLEEFGGSDADGSEILGFPLTTPYSPHRRPDGYPFNAHHYGIDLRTPAGTVLHAPTSGTVSQQSDYNGGLIARLVSGKIAQYFLHLQKVLKTGHVKQGDAIVRTGNSGHMTTGAHLHYQVEGGPSAALSNRNTMDPIAFLKSKSGGSIKGGIQGKGTWAQKIRQAAKQMHTSVTESQVQGILAQIQRESNFNESIVQGNIGDINNLRGTPARGLLQYVPSTFANYKVRGYENINNGYHQLLAFFNNSNWARNLPYGRSGWTPNGHRRYENGGLVTHHQFAELGEGNKPELVIPLTRRSRAIQLIEQAMSIIGMDSHTGNVTVNNDGVVAQLMQIVQMQQEQLEELKKQTAMLAQDRTIITKMDGREIARTTHKYHKEIDVRVQQFNPAF